MSTTRTFLVALAGGAILLSGAAASFAQPPQGPGLAGQQGGPPGRGGGGEVKALHDQLAITPAEDQAFAAWVTATRRPAGPPPGQGMTTPQRLDAQIAQLTARANATKRFYASLTPAQQQTFDALPPGVALGEPGGGRGGRGGGRGGRGGPPPANGGYNPQ